MINARLEGSAWWHAWMMRMRMRMWASAGVRRLRFSYFQHSFPHPYVAPAPYLGELQNCMLSFFPRRRSPNSICAFTLHPLLSGPFVQPLTYDEGRYIKEVAKDPNRAVFPDW